MKKKKSHDEKTDIFFPHSPPNNVEDAMRIKMSNH
jgi:hypothetical protein